MAANMYRVGGMYVNVDLFICIKQQPPASLASPWALGEDLVYGFYILKRDTAAVAWQSSPSWIRKVIISKYLGFKMGQASFLSWPQQQLAARLLPSFASSSM